MINLLILTLIVLATSVVNAFIDNYLIKKKWGKVKNLNHTSRTIIRLIIFGTSIGFIYGFAIYVQEYMWQMLLELFKPFLLLLYSFLLFNITFDPLLNHLRNLPWYYDGKDAITDQISNEFKSGLQYSYLLEDSSDEILAYTELGFKVMFIFGLIIWILLI